MISKRQYVIRRVDGRLIGTAANRDEARSVARAIVEREDAAAIPLMVDREDVAAIPLIVDGQQDADALLNALEYVLRLDPHECEQQFMAELREKLARRYPGGGE